MIINKVTTKTIKEIYALSTEDIANVAVFMEKYWEDISRRDYTSVNEMVDANLVDLLDDLETEGEDFFEQVLPGVVPKPMSLEVVCEYDLE